VYYDLLQREGADEAAGIPPADHPSVPHARGDLLTKRNFKIWLTMVRAGRRWSRRMR
jgi:hypothetical protein